MNMMTVEDASEFIRGITFKPHELIDVSDPDAIVCMRTKNIQADLDQRDLIAVPSRLVRQERKLLRAGDILISSANSWELVGKCSFVPELPYRATAGGFIAIVRPKSRTHPRFLYHWLNSPATQHVIRNMGRQTTNISNLDVNRFKEIELPAYNFDQQRRIAAILDKADAIRRKREQGLVLADDFLRSVFLGKFGRPKQPNPAFKTRPLGEICGLFAGNSLPAGEPYSGQGGGHLLLKVGDLNLPGNDQTVMSAREWLSEKARTGAAIVAPKDAIVFPKRGGAIATNKKRVLGRSCILDPNLIAVAPKTDSPVSFPYLRMWFELLDLASISNGSTVPQLNKGDLYPLEIGECQLSCRQGS